MLLWFTPEVRVDSSVPELLHGFPVFNLTTTNDILHIVCLLMSPHIFTDVVVKLWILEIALIGYLCSTLADGIC